jgi:hypothetical protein
MPSFAFCGKGIAASMFNGCSEGIMKSALGSSSPEAHDELFFRIFFIEMDPHTYYCSQSMSMTAESNLTFPSSGSRRLRAPVARVTFLPRLVNSLQREAAERRMTSSPISQLLHRVFLAQGSQHIRAVLPQLPPQLLRFLYPPIGCTSAHRSHARIQMSW